MKIQSVLIQRLDPHTAEVLATSAVLIEEKYILATYNLLHHFLEENKDLVRKINVGKIYFSTRKFHVFWKNEGNDIFTTKYVNLFGLFKCKNIDKFCKNDFKDWSIYNSETNNNKEFVSIFLILAVENEIVNEENLKSVLYAWLMDTTSVKISKCDRVLCISTPFGNRDFLNSVSEGIVSTTFKDSTLFLSDCTTAPGCEGGLVYIKNNLDLPLGIVISPFNWWRKDWIGFTLVADIRPILLQILASNQQISNKVLQMDTFSRLLSTSENCLAQVNCGINWGTGILLSNHKRIFITNAHVVREHLKIRLLWKNELTTAHLIYKAPDDSVFDLAVVQADVCWSSMSPPDLRIIPYKTGDTVYCAGYPLLSTVSQRHGVTITHGVISASQPYLIRTTCGVYPGFSGGAVFNPSGVFLGIIVCNTKLTDVQMVYPKYNMAIPFRIVSEVIFKYLKTDDQNVLTKLEVSNSEAERVWWKLEGKL